MSPLRGLHVPASLLLVTALVFPAPAAAQTFVDGTTLGIADVLEFRDRSTEIPVPIPVAQGLIPRALTATVQIPAEVETGHLEAWTGDLLLTRIDLDGSVESVPIEVPLDGVEVRAGVLDLSLRTVLRSGGEACPDWSERALELRDTVVEFDGEPWRPEVLADFVPPVLERLEIYLPDEPTLAQSEAAAQLATTSAATFGRRGIEIAVLSSSAPRPESASPFTRRVEIREDDQALIELNDDAVPTVVIRGNNATLPRETRSVSSGLRSLAVTRTATLDSPDVAPRALITEATLDELGIGTRTARSAGTVEVGFGLDQTSLAAVAGDVTIDLVGSYSPPPSDRSGLIVVSAGDTVLDSWTADHDGEIDRTISVPASALARYTDITVSLQTAGASAACGLLQPLTLIVDGSSRVELSEPTSPAPDGFASLPQALMPRVQVATGSGSLEDTARAVNILAGLQALSATPLQPEWVNSEELLDGDAPGLFVTSDRQPSDVDLPLELTGGRTLEVTGARDNEPATLRFYQDVDFASIQVVEESGRALLVASTSSGSGELDRTLEWLGSERERWSSLTGNVLFTAPGREPLELATAESVQVEATDAESGGGVGTTLLIGLAVTVVGAGIAGLVWAVSRRRRLSDRQ